MFLFICFLGWVKKNSSGVCFSQSHFYTTTLVAGVSAKQLTLRLQFLFLTLLSDDSAIVRTSTKNASGWVKNQIRSSLSDWVKRDFSWWNAIIVQKLCLVGTWDEWSVFTRIESFSEAATHELILQTYKLWKCLQDGLCELVYLGPTRSYCLELCMSVDLSHWHSFPITGVFAVGYLAQSKELWRCIKYVYCEG